MTIEKRISPYMSLSSGMPLLAAGKVLWIVTLTERVKFRVRILQAVAEGVEWFEDYGSNRFRTYSDLYSIRGKVTHAAVDSRITGAGL